MAVNRDPILKRCRSLELNPAFLGYDKKSNRTLLKSRRKVSEYGLQLRAKQQAKFVYGVLEKQFRNYYAKATKMEGKAGENLLITLESRLDSVIFRLGWALTRRESRQLVTHGHFMVNGKRVDIPSYLVKVGDVITINEKSRQSSKIKSILELNASRPVIKWLERNNETFTAKVLAMPTRADIDLDIDETLIVELYSK